MLESPVTLTLLFANIAISLWALYMNTDYLDKFAEYPYLIVHEKKYYQMITSAFLHADIMHLAFNMFALYSFGSILERVFAANLGMTEGRVCYILVYFISLLSGSVLTVARNYKNPSYVAVGASGAVSGIVFSYILFFPMSTVGFFFIPMPAFVFAFLYLGVSVWGMKNKTGNIGHEAHLGGVIGGIISTFILVEGSFGFFLNHFG